MNKEILPKKLQLQYAMADSVMYDFITCIYDSHWWTGQKSAASDITLPFKSLHVPFLCI
jgi:hypothetical protein